MDEAIDSHQREQIASAEELRATPEFGITLPRTLAPEHIIEFSQLAEGLGFQKINMLDHVALRDDKHAETDKYIESVPFTDPTTTLAAIVGATNEMRVQTAIIVPALYDTLHLARQTANLANMSGGRFEMGVGVGWSKYEYQVMGRDFHKRGPLLEKSIQNLKTLWRGGEIEHNGVPVGINPHANYPIPIYFGGRADKAIERAAKLGDGFILQSPENTLLEDSTRIQKADPKGRLKIQGRINASRKAEQLPEEVDSYIEAGVRSITFSFTEGQNELPSDLNFYAPLLKSVSKQIASYK